MRAFAAFLMAYAAVAAAFAAGVKRSSVKPSQPSGQPSGQPSVSLPQRLPPSATPLLYAAAIAALVAAVLLWPPDDGLAMAAISTTLALSLAATSFVLLEPLWPRALWALAIASPLLAAALALLA